MYHARVFVFAVARPERPVRRPPAAGRRAGARRLAHWLSLRRPGR